MTHAAASIGVEYDGEDLQQSDLSWFFEITRGLPPDAPEVRGIDIVIPGLAGQIPGDRQYDTRKILLKGFVMGVGSTHDEQQTSFRTSMTALGVIFDPTREPAQLECTLEGGNVAEIDARPLSNLIINEVVQSLFAYISVELLSVSPNWDIEALGS